MLLLVLSASAGCLTPGETRSLREQVDEIGGQVVGVRKLRDLSREEIERSQVAPGPIAPAAREVVPAPAMAGEPPKPAPGGETPREDRTPARPAAAPESQGLYREGYALYHRGEFESAEIQLKRFLAAHAASPLADNAQYWIGECRYARGLYRKAIEAFKAVVDRYPSGNKVPDALYKIALCQLKLGERGPARKSLQAVVRRYPGSDVAPLASARLEGR